jgi:hypothetical protein
MAVRQNKALKQRSVFLRGNSPGAAHAPASASDFAFVGKQRGKLLGHRAGKLVGVNDRHGLTVVACHVMADADGGGAPDNCPD